MVKAIRLYQQIPTQLAEYIIHNDLSKPFQIYMYFKCCANGIVNKKSDVFKSAKETLEINDNRTFKKHFERLLELNWIGHNTKSQNYFIRSIDAIRIQNNFTKRQSATFHYKHIKNMREFLCASIICASVKGQKYFFEVAQKRKSKTAVNKLVAALQVETSSSSTQNWMPRKLINDKASANKRNENIKIPDYYGLSLIEMSKKLRCSKTTACEIKHSMHKAGFIKVKHHEQVIGTIASPDYIYRNQFYAAYPELVGRLSFRRRTIKLKVSKNNAEANKKTKTLIDVVLLMHDEIIPKIKFKQVPKFSSISNLKAEKISPQSKVAA